MKNRFLNALLSDLTENDNGHDPLIAETDPQLHARPQLPNMTIP